MLFLHVEILSTRETRTEDLLNLLNASFPNTDYSRKYIEWLYHENPSGEVIGYDMYENKQLIGHYACIPTNVDGQKGFLSVNTATHPDHQGRGIFRSLAEETFKIVESQKSFVIGVANQNSAETFVKRLQFELIGNLNLRFGRVSVPEIGSKIWSDQELTWRAKNPRSIASFERIEKNVILFKSKIYGTPFELKALVKTNNESVCSLTKFGFTVDWNRDSNSFLSLPRKMKPSPLALILKNFSKQKVIVNSWNFVDFDAF